MNSIKKLALVAGVLALACGTVFAQEAAPADPHAGGKSWLELFEATGIVGWLLLGVSIAGTALVIEHSTSIRRDKIAPPDLVDELDALIESENYKDAIAVCDDEKGYLANLIGNALRMRHAGYEEMIGVLEQTAAEETFKLTAKISYLSLLGNVAPLLGLLGTVLGMIRIFAAVSNAGIGDPEALSGGISEAMVTTAAGLFIGIPALVAYNWLNARADRVIFELETYASRLLDALRRRRAAVDERTGRA